MKINKVKRFEYDNGAFFAGANSAQGFKSFYSSVLCDGGIDRVYILKGGPGTGKSSFMKEAERRAIEKGLGVERYNCSSDPDSLDGLVIGARCAILDGTAPHTVEASLPGARDEIIDLGKFWDSRRLEEKKQSIIAASEAKSECYKKAYRYLEACANVRDIKEKLALPYFLEDKARRAVERVFSQIKSGGGYSLDYGIISSVGMKGRVRLDTYERIAERVFVLDDFYGFAHRYLAMLVEKAAQSDTPVRISYDPIDCKRLDAVFFENDQTAFVIGRGKEGNCDDVRVNIKRFADVSGIGDIRGEYRFDTRLEEALLDSALESLNEAGEYHFELEKIYSECMDFEAQSVFCKNFLDNLFDDQSLFEKNV